MIVDLTPELAQAIAFSLSERDLTEVLALQPVGKDIESELETWAREIFNVPTHLRQAWAVAVGDEPVAMGGVVRHPYMPHLASTWTVGTDRKIDGAVQVMKAAIQAHREWEARGVTKFQCSCLDSPELSSEWLLRLGYGIEGKYPGFGRNGETFIVWGRNHGR